MAVLYSDIVTASKSWKRVASYAMNAPVISTSVTVNGYGGGNNDAVLFKLHVSAKLLFSYFFVNKPFAGGGATTVSIKYAKINTDGSVGSDLRLVAVSSVDADTPAGVSQLFVFQSDTVLKQIKSDDEAGSNLGDDEYVYLVLAMDRNLTDVATLQAGLFYTSASTAGTPLEEIAY